MFGSRRSYRYWVGGRRRDAICARVHCSSRGARQPRADQVLMRGEPNGPRCTCKRLPPVSVSVHLWRRCRHKLNKQGGPERSRQTTRMMGRRAPLLPRDRRSTPCSARAASSNNADTCLPPPLSLSTPSSIVACSYTSKFSYFSTKMQAVSAGERESAGGGIGILHCAPPPFLAPPPRPGSLQPSGPRKSTRAIV